ncbi:MAG: hypothetical protein BJBARM4_0816 [Candidatus Parvarchaeum acidiphilum ARMAN-4]|jgi:hypothetical protein|uniref:Uncharacterized protein n=1 Tax=Candidatus Parvarchaeum acidiphilum ARMAN-4 TaxID=662760 RepID=D2EGB6_PARA4|nr:hypothetical protein [Candidatus Parvarchaeum acidiphilum ARMAN-4]EEZ92599.1 MAG: hypothetical protein BJBARM4_0816 [Candidatus Parvarchaeum acidiphilum ARMAN-4]
MEEFEVSFGNKEKVEKKADSKLFSYLRFETVNLELFICTVLASLFESSADKQLSFTIQGVLFFLVSLAANVLLIELIFRFMKVVKNGKIRRSRRSS